LSSVTKISSTICHPCPENRRESPAQNNYYAYSHRVNATTPSAARKPKLANLNATRISCVQSPYRNPMSSKFDEVAVTETKIMGFSDKNTKFWILVTGIIFFFSIHNYMQELIMSLPGFKVSLTIVYFTSACVSWSCCRTDRHHPWLPGGIGRYRLLRSGTADVRRLLEES
jgi:hypothetical protein